MSFAEFSPWEPPQDIDEPWPDPPDSIERDRLEDLGYFDEDQP